MIYPLDITKVIEEVKRGILIEPWADLDAVERGGKGSGHHGHGGLPGVHGGSTPSGGDTDSGVIWPSDIDHKEFEAAMLKWNSDTQSIGVMSIGDFVAMEEGTFTPHKYADSVFSQVSLWLTPSGEAIFVPGEHRDSVEEALDAMGILGQVQPANEITGGLSGIYENWYLVQIAKEMGYVRAMVRSGLVPRMNLEYFEKLTRKQKGLIQDIVNIHDINRFSLDYTTEEGEEINKIGIPKNEFGWEADIEWRSKLE